MDDVPPRHGLAPRAGGAMALAGGGGMNVVLFCGGLGIRLRAHAPGIPKPLVKIGSEPILSHLMRWYAHHGHRDFVLCLGHGGERIVRHFLQCVDLVATEAFTGRVQRMRLRTASLGVWTVTLVPTGRRASIGERLRVIRSNLEGPIFLANYADGLSNLDLPGFLEQFVTSGAIGALITVRPHSSLHLVSVSRQGLVESVRPAAESGLRVNGGFFAFRREVFDWLAPGEDLVDGLFPRLVAERKLFGYPHDGFWACMDTPKDWHALQEMEAREQTPWKPWLWPPGGSGPRVEETPRPAHGHVGAPR
jgi:glucose-1-phosphate cytidylyltransferase